MKTKKLIAAFLCSFALTTAIIAATPVIAQDTAAPAQTATPNINGEAFRRALKKDKAAPLTPLEQALQALKKCASNPERADRLICYDSFALEKNLMSETVHKEQVEAIENIGFWKIVAQKDKTGIETIYLKTPSTKPVLTSTGINRVPEFVLRCSEQKTDAYLDWKGPISINPTPRETYYVEFRFDDQPTMSGQWELSFDKMAAFAPQPIEFVKKLKRTQILTVQITPAGESAQTLTFNLDKIDNALSVLVRRCYN